MTSGQAFDFDQTDKLQQTFANIRFFVHINVYIQFAAYGQLLKKCCHFCVKGICGPKENNRGKCLTALVPVWFIVEQLLAY